MARLGQRAMFSRATATLTATLQSSSCKDRILYTGLGIIISCKGRKDVQPEPYFNPSPSSTTIAMNDGIEECVTMMNTTIIEFKPNLLVQTFC